MLDLGQKLKKKRESLGFTLVEVAKKTNISLNYLEALECGNFAELPDVYMKMFLRTYSKFLGVVVTFSHHKIESEESTNMIIEESELPTALNQAKKIINDDLDFSTPISISMPEEESHYTESPYKVFIAKYFKLLASSLIGLVIITTMLIISFVMEDEKKGEIESSIIKVITVESDQNNDFNINVTDSLQTNSSILNDSISFRIKAVDSCYVLYYTDNHEVKERMLLPNNQMNIKAQFSMELKVGNIQGISLFFNGKELVDSLINEKSGSAYLRVSAGEGAYFIKKSDKVSKYLKDVYGIGTTDTEKKE